MSTFQTVLASLMISHQTAAGCFRFGVKSKSVGYAEPSADLINAEIARDVLEARIGRFEAKGDGSNARDASRDCVAYYLRGIACALISEGC